MAGQDQSANLGGMLSQIGATVGSMGGALNPLLNAAQKPQGDPNDPKHLQKLAEWAARTGDTASAQMYSQQARDLSGEMKKQATAKAMNTTTSAYAKALESGDQQKIDEAYNTLLDTASANGQDGFQRTTAVQQAYNTQVDRQEAQAEKLRLAKEEKVLDKLGVDMNNASTPKEISDLVKNAPPEVAMAVQQLAITRSAYLKNEQAAAQEAKLNKTAINTDIHIDPKLPQEIKDALKAEQAVLEDKIAKGFVNNTWLPGARRGAAQMRKDLADKAFAESAAMHRTAQAQHNARQKEYRAGQGRIARNAPSKDETKAIRSELFNENNTLWDSAAEADAGWGPQTVIDTWRERQTKELEGLYPEFVTTAGDKSTTKQSTDIPKVTTQAEFDALEIGDEFYNADGSRARK